MCDPSFASRGWSAYWTDPFYHLDNEKSTDYCLEKFQLLNPLLNSIRNKILSSTGRLSPNLFSSYLIYSYRLVAAIYSFIYFFYEFLRRLQRVSGVVGQVFFTKDRPYQQWSNCSLLLCFWHVSIVMKLWFVILEICCLWTSYNPIKVTSNSLAVPLPMIEFVVKKSHYVSLHTAWYQPILL